MRPFISFLLISLFTLSSEPVDACSYKLNGKTTSQDLKKVKKIVVKNDVDLKGKTLILSENNIILFKGGSISNGELVFCNTKLAGDVKMYCHVSGSLDNKEVYVDWFMPQNDLDFLYQTGFYSLTGLETIRFEKKEYVSSVHGRSNGIQMSNVVIDGDGATIRARKGGNIAYSLLYFVECNNIQIKNLILKGSDEDSNEEGARHNISLSKCSCVLIENVVSYKAFTDGLYIRKCDDVRVNHFESYESGRQGCSVTAGSNLFFFYCVFDGSYRVAPKAGFDIEPNYATDTIDNIVIERCSFTNNVSTGLTMKLRQGETERQCNITIDDCLFDGNGVNISLGSAPNSGNGEVEIKNCVLRNSKGVSFQSKCYSAEGTPLVSFHDSQLENANVAGGGDVREQAAVISVHNIASKPLKSEYGNIHLYNLRIKQDDIFADNLKNAIVFYPDANVELSNVSATDISFDIKKKEDLSFKLMSAPKGKTKNVRVGKVFSTTTDNIKNE